MREEIIRMKKNSAREREKRVVREKGKWRKRRR